MSFRLFFKRKNRYDRGQITIGIFASLTRSRSAFVAAIICIKQIWMQIQNTINILTVNLTCMQRKQLFLFSDMLCYLFDFRRLPIRDTAQADSIGILQEMSQVPLSHRSSAMDVRESLNRYHSFSSPSLSWKIPRKPPSRKSQKHEVPAVVISPRDFCIPSRISCSDASFNNRCFNPVWWSNKVFYITW